MKTFYAIEKKSFYYVLSGTECQIADLGSIPALFTSLKKAKEYMSSMNNLYVKKLNQQLVQVYDSNECDDCRVIDRVEYLCPKTNVRTCVTLYKVYSI